MNKCKEKTCLNNGDCMEQCLSTLFYTDETIYERAVKGDPYEILQAAVASKPQNLEPPAKPRSEYGWIKDFAILSEKLIDIFSDIQKGHSRLILFYIGDDRIMHHYIIFSRSENSIYMLDPKNKIINKNSDILYHPWFNKQFDFDTYDWSITKYNPYFGLYFWPIYNEDQSDVNSNKDVDK